MLRCWRRLDQPGLEFARIEPSAGGICVASTLIDGGASPFSLHYHWSLDPEWRTRSLRIDWSNEHDRTLVIEREGEADWKIDGQPAPHLAGCVELDLSATPFCNGLAIRRLRRSGDLRTAWINAADLSIAASRQRYEKLDARNWRYIDMGVARGFEAGLHLDADGHVERYEGLFEGLECAPTTRPPAPEAAP
jgi:hypothetical protein